MLAVADDLRKQLNEEAREKVDKEILQQLERAELQDAALKRRDSDYRVIEFAGRKFQILGTRLLHILVERQVRARQVSCMKRVYARLRDGKLEQDWKDQQWKLRHGELKELLAEVNDLLRKQCDGELGHGGSERRLIDALKGLLDLLEELQDPFTFAERHASMRTLFQLTAEYRKLLRRRDKELPPPPH